jgi:hypothetical protein
MTCASNDTMTFDPASPLVGDEVTITVRSVRGYVDISLVPASGAEAPTWIGVTQGGSYYYWRWKITYNTAGSRSYSFKINAGTLTCASGTLSVSAGTDTPTPTPTHTPTPTYTPTPEPVYGVTLSGITFLPVYPGETATFDVDLHNTGNVEDTFNVYLSAPPTGWGAEFCIDQTCYDYTQSPQPVTTGADLHKELQIKLSAPGDATAGQGASVTLRAQSQTDATASAQHQVDVQVSSPP